MPLPRCVWSITSWGRPSDDGSSTSRTRAPLARQSLTSSAIASFETVRSEEFARTAISLAFGAPAAASRSTRVPKRNVSALGRSGVASG